MSQNPNQPPYCGLLEPANGPLEVVVCPRASLCSVVRCSVEVSIRTVANFYDEEKLTCQECQHRKICEVAAPRVRDIRTSQERYPETFISTSV